MAEKITPTERVLDLMIALVNSRTRMSKAQIRERVRGYHGEPAAFERTFERDKDLLRELGVPLVVERDPVHEDDVGYRIDVDAYRVPTAEFTPQEIGVLALAAAVHNDATWRTQAGRGVTKALGLGPVAEEAAPPLRLALRTPEASFEPLLDAIETRSRVSFQYSSTRSPRAVRHLQPWRVVARHHGWYVIGWDEDREAVRAFRLSRIEGEVTPGGPHGREIPAELDVDAVIGHRSDPVTVRVALAPERAALLRARGRVVGTHDVGGQAWDVVEYEATDQRDAAEEIASHGPDALALEPAAVRDDVIARLRAAVEVTDAR